MSRQVVEQNRLSENNRPIYRQVAYVLEEMICKNYQPGDYLPSENDLALQFKVNRHTIRRATDDLVSAGFVLRKQGKGSLVINNQIQYSLSAGRFTETLDKLRRKTNCQIINSQIMSCNSKMAEYLVVPKGTPIVVIDTLRLVDDQPMSLITHLLNPEYVPDIEKYYQSGSLHACIKEHYDLELERGSVLISALMPNKDEAFHLKTSLMHPLLKIKSFNCIKGSPKKLVEVSLSRSRSDRFQVKI